ncbi:endoplasmic reticulum resident protein 44-like [Culex pipiens pallens]|uniref:endoplasmic reticulum resident protein 44-like n=1 Tax=Culex pipiens pallens TaxID=42434 RepID=UPI0022AAD6C0|nr:endoplasmic reticulum resident protein 44-like [Culex pipiens pallens]
MNVLSSAKSAIFSYLMVVYLFYNPTDSGAVQLNSENLDMTLASNELVFINFYAEWCRFSNILQPIFDEAADKLQHNHVTGVQNNDRHAPQPGRHHGRYE